jgi:transposase InsO family protein
MTALAGLGGGRPEGNASGSDVRLAQMYQPAQRAIRHPFEHVLLELSIRHRYTRLYRPQTNGKVERFWKPLNDDLIEETIFDSIQNFNNTYSTAIPIDPIRD